MNDNDTLRNAMAGAVAGAIAVCSAWPEETDVGWDMAPAYMPGEAQTAEMEPTRH